MAEDAELQGPSQTKKISPNIALGKLADVLLGKLFREVNRQLVSGENIESILKFVDSSLAFIIPYDRMAIGIVESDHLAVSWTNFPSIHVYLEQEAPIPLNNSHLREILKIGRPKIVTDLARFSALNPELKISQFAAREGLQSSLTCPLRSKGQIIGMVVFFSFAPGFYHEEHIEAFLEIADQLSAVVAAGWMTTDLKTSETLRMVLHDLKSPLSVIQGLIEHHSRSGALTPEISATLRRNADFMFGILEDLVELDQLNTRKETILKCTVQLAEFVEDVVRNAQLMGAAKEISIGTKIDPSLPEKVSIDPIKVRRVADNLISNAIKFSKRGTQVLISVWSAEDRIGFSVKDHGPGIPTTEFTKLFKEFGKTKEAQASG
jgi:signal transduction histidine kinase